MMHLASRIFYPIQGALHSNKSALAHLKHVCWYLSQYNYVMNYAGLYAVGHLYIIISLTALILSVVIFSCHDWISFRQSDKLEEQLSHFQLTSFKEK